MEVTGGWFLVVAIFFTPIGLGECSLLRQKIGCNMVKFKWVCMEKESHIQPNRLNETWQDVRQYFYYLPPLDGSALKCCFFTAPFVIIPPLFPFCFFSMLQNVVSWSSFDAKLLKLSKLGLEVGARILSTHLETPRNTKIRLIWFLSDILRLQVKRGYLQTAFVKT